MSVLNIFPGVSNLFDPIVRLSYSRSMALLSLLLLLLFYFQLRTATFKAYCAIWFRRSNFRHQASPRVSPRESTQRRKVELWARNVREFCLNADLHVTFRDLLHSLIQSQFSTVRDFCAFCSICSIFKVIQ